MYALFKKMLTAELKAIIEDEYKHSLESLAKGAHQWINLDGIFVE